MPLFTAVRRFDLDRGTAVLRDYGVGNGVAEPLFVPRSSTSAEDDGYLIVLVYQQVSNTSEFHILDSRDITAEPIARVLLPHRVPYGFHGNWVAAS